MTVNKGVGARIGEDKGLSSENAWDVLFVTYSVQVFNTYKFPGQCQE